LLVCPFFGIIVAFKLAESRDYSLYMLRFNIQTMSYIKVFFGILLLFFSFALATAQDTGPVKHLPATPQSIKTIPKKNTLTEKLCLGLPADSLVKAGIIRQDPNFPLIYRFKSNPDWEKMPYDSVELHALTLDQRKILISARMFVAPSPAYMHNWHDKLYIISDAKLYRDSEIDSSIRMGDRPTVVYKTKKVYGKWFDGYIETFTPNKENGSKHFQIDVARIDLWTKFLQNHQSVFYQSSPTELKHDSSVVVTEPPNCENINDLYASIRLPFQLKNKTIERVYARILVSADGKMQNLIITTKNPDALTAQALLPALTRLKFKPAIHEKKAIPFWITLPIQLENKK